MQQSQSCMGMRDRRILKLSSFPTTAPCVFSEVVVMCCVWSDNGLYTPARVLYMDLFYSSTSYMIDKSFRVFFSREEKLESCFKTAAMVNAFLSVGFGGLKDHSFQNCWTVRVTSRQHLTLNMHFEGKAFCTPVAVSQSCHLPKDGWNLFVQMIDTSWMREMLSTRLLSLVQKAGPEGMDWLQNCWSDVEVFLSLRAGTQNVRNKCCLHPTDGSWHVFQLSQVLKFFCCICQSFTFVLPGWT